MKFPRLPMQPCWITDLTLLSLFAHFAFPLTAQEEKVKHVTRPLHTQLIQDIPYAKHDGVSLTLNLYRPETIPENRLPVVLWVHGGGWLNGSKDKCPAAFLATHGFAVVSVGYRLTDVAQWPGQIEDCSAAVRWVRKNAGEYHLNPAAVGAWGSSAGGHLVALMGTRPTGAEAKDIRLQAVCDWFGPTDLLTMPPNVVSEKRSAADVAKSNGAKLLGAPVPEVPDLARDASALYHVSSDDPPFLIMHGTADPGVPLIQSRRFHEALTAVGVDSTFVMLEGAGHGGKEFSKPEVEQQVIDFFSRYLK